MAQSERSANEFVVLLRKKHSITLDRRRSALGRQADVPTIDKEWHKTTTDRPPKPREQTAIKLVKAGKATVFIDLFADY